MFTTSSLWRHGRWVSGSMGWWSQGHSLCRQPFVLALRVQQPSLLTMYLRIVYDFFVGTDIFFKVFFLHYFTTSKLCCGVVADHSTGLRFTYNTVYTYFTRVQWMLYFVCRCSIGLIMTLFTGQPTHIFWPRFQVARYYPKLISKGPFSTPVSSSAKQGSPW